MIYAVIKEDLVTNVIVLDEEQVEEMSAALGAELIDARPYGLAIGDLRTDAGWTRNAGGEQIVLPLLDQEQYDSYSIAAARIVELEAAQEMIAEQAASGAAAEAIDILTGEVVE